MKIDKNSRAVTSFFMVAAVVVMLALAWSVARDNNRADDSAAVQAVQDAAAE